MTLAEVSNVLGNGLSDLFTYSVAPEGAVRVRTPFMYPDGDVVDVFIEGQGPEFVVTDYGESLDWLRMQSFSGALTTRQRRLIDDVCQTLDVELDRDQLTLSCESPSSLAEAVQRLGQASVRVADVWFTFRVTDSSALADDVGDWLRRRSFEFDRNVLRTGRSGREWRMNYRVIVQTRTSLVFLLSTGTAAWARRLSERVFAACSDLSHLVGDDPDSGFVSLFDDSHDVWSDVEFNLLGTVSRIATWSQPEEFERVLTTG